MQPDWAIAAPRITNTSTYDDPEVKAMDAKVDGYYTLLPRQGQAVRRRARRIPSTRRCARRPRRSSTRRSSASSAPQDALDKMAAAAEDELTKLGYRK